MANNRRIKQYFELNKSGFFIDDITANDINFDAVFDKVNKTVSSLGEELLYFVLRKPKLSTDELDAFEKDIAYFESADVNPSKIKKELTLLSKLDNISVFEYLECLDNIKPRKKRMLFLPIVAFLLALSAFNFNATLAILLIVALFCVNTVTYFKINKNVKPFIVCFAYIIKSIKTAEKINEIDTKEYSSFLNIKRFSFILGSLSGTTAHGGMGSPLDMLFDLLKMAFHLDIISFYFMVDSVKKNKKEITSLLEHIGMIDVYLSVTEYRRSLNYFCIPQIVDKKYFLMEDGYHALIDNPVANSLCTEKSVLLTGSNASGKSTFLRTVLVNAMLSQTINTALAHKYIAPIFMMSSSMSLSDCVLLGDSFYMAEIKSVKRIIELISQNENYYVLCVVDELLKGTNTIERIASGSTILEYLDTDKCMTFAATHDIELTKILIDKYSNYHFSEDISGDDISFSYVLKEGPSKTTNAIKLLEHLDFPEEIVDESLNRVTAFKDSGTW